MSDATPRTPEQSLRDEVAALEVDEILALCYAFQHRRERLRLYLDVLRSRGGQRAQFASCLICFDLARQGDETAQQEFAFLADTMRQLAEASGLVDGLVGGDPYLSFLWELCQAQLEEMDPRFEAEALATSGSATEVASFDLLTDDDFDDFGITVDATELWLRFDRAVEDFLGGRPGEPVYDADAGFRVHSKQDVQRMERFLLELESLRDVVPPAAGYRALALLFYGTHLRSRSLFGAINPRKQELLRDGLTEFVRSGPQIWEVAGAMGELHAPAEAWEKIADVVHDYCAWVALDARHAEIGPAGYDAVERLLNRQPLSAERRRSER